MAGSLGDVNLWGRNKLVKNSNIWDHVARTTPQKLSLQKCINSNVSAPNRTEGNVLIAYHGAMAVFEIIQLYVLLNAEADRACFLRLRSVFSSNGAYISPVILWSDTINIESDNK